jgi:hypothetical protein
MSNHTTPTLHHISGQRGIVCGIPVEIVPVTLLKNGDYFYPVVQETNSIAIDDGMSWVVKQTQINRNTGGTYVVTDKGRIDHQIGARVAREVQA